MVATSSLRAIFVVLLAGAAASHGQEARSPIAWQTDYGQAREQARAESKPMLLDFYATWCGPCKMMEAQTYGDGRVREALKEYVPVKIDIDKESKLAFAFKIHSIPRTLVVNIHGETVGDQLGFMDAEEFLEFLGNVREFTHKKVGGVVIEVPDDAAPARNSKRVDISKDAGLDELIELMSAPDPAVRKATRASLLERPETERARVVEALRESDYLGARIAGWETMMENARDANIDFDPWAGASRAAEQPRAEDPERRPQPEGDEQ